jgi:hypothetical protein
MDLFYIWFFRDNVYYFIMCWCLTLGKLGCSALPAQFHRVTCWAETHWLVLGPIASAIITWRNSLVFHSLDKVSLKAGPSKDGRAQSETLVSVYLRSQACLSTCIHLLPSSSSSEQTQADRPVLKESTRLTAISIPTSILPSSIRHFAKDREVNYPAIVKVKEFSWWQMILWSALPCECSHWEIR